MTGCTAVEGVLQHLMFHKAMIDEDDRAEKIDHYLSVLQEREAQVAPQDPLDRSLEMVFELVLNNNLDPWDIDLMEFARLYAGKVKEAEVNFVIAGKLMLMAWSILRLQSEQVLSSSERRESSFYDDFDFDSLDIFAPEVPQVRLCLPDEVELDEVVRHKGCRPVTLVELLDAFADARLEEEQNRLREEARARNRAKLEKFETKAHNDDMERDVEDVWQRILRCGSGPVALEDIWDGGREDLVTVLMALLFLARNGKIAVWQDDLPHGRIYLEVKMAWDIGTLEDVPAVPVPQPVRGEREAVM